MKRDKDKLMAFEMRCYRRILHIRQQMITNEEVQIRIKCQLNVLQMVMEGKFNLFGHIFQMNNSILIQQVVGCLAWQMNLESEEDQTKSGSTT